jgi:uncharacterized damage-inducible protein DinB
MSPRAQLNLLAKYNQSMNQSLYCAAASLSSEQVSINRGAFFGSILGTLNHLAVADTVWLKRFSTHSKCAAALEELRSTPAPTDLEETLHADLASLWQYRQWLDAIIIKFIEEVPHEALEEAFSYSSMKGIPSTRELFSVLLHFFNHQTHHRGQVSTLLFQAGVDVGVTDLLPLVPQMK